jgi:hypothetical protein
LQRLSRRNLDRACVAAGAACPLASEGFALAKNTFSKQRSGEDRLTEKPSSQWPPKKKFRRAACKWSAALLAAFSARPFKYFSDQINRFKLTSDTEYPSPSQAIEASHNSSHGLINKCS